MNGQGKSPKSLGDKTSGNIDVSEKNKGIKKEVKKRS